ncbi:vesicle transport protein GOT1B, putative [Entamoeba invadens IP1]|uniref:Vesicle transport protein GOT1B, putative n=1 Tax=Entamoeba invadens IP1 TaxID=370355 RepID=A0A0A1U6S0_ENTIV|nr:vesicle transport protein GOT1B, putative [Entamoeba invadens IP1]ELP90020.1 vesicle transport protein GOT1B, putative [Entamoeba invadens IP1]|eukprot:XP_004256791.1 vesicle transport protein GOT1B, putative [Entamoeba invadens IP1]
MLTDLQKIGVVVTCLGLFFTLLGIVFMFDRGFLTFGNILFVCGIFFVTGVQQTFAFFFQKKRAVATFFFFVGIFLILIKFTFIGLVVEFFGFLNLFANFLPVVLAFLRRIPIIGDLLNTGCIKQFIDRTSPDYCLPE